VDPVALLRDDRRTPTALSAFWSYTRSTDPAQVGPDAAAQYSAVMTATQPLVAAQVTSCYDFAAHRRLLDVGGGEGAFLATVAVCAPALQLGLFELPAVAAAARDRLQAAKVPDVEVFAGNLLTDALPAGFDCITLVRVCFDHDDEVVQALLRRVHAALPPGGRVVVAEPMAGLPHARGVEAYFTMYLTAMRSGRIRSEREFVGLMRNAGFRSSEPLRAALPLQTGIVVGRR
jgi:demethylspheroidene O-methyltransferase